MELNLLLCLYDAKNPEALKTILAGGTKMKIFPKDVMDGAWDAAQETYAELEASSEDFKKIYGSMKQFQKDQNQWMSVSEGPLDSYMQRKLK